MGYFLLRLGDISFDLLVERSHVDFHVHWIWKSRKSVFVGLFQMNRKGSYFLLRNVIKVFGLRSFEGYLLTKNLQKALPRNENLKTEDTVSWKSIIYKSLLNLHKSNILFWIIHQNPFTKRHFFRGKFMELIGFLFGYHFFYSCYQSGHVQKLFICVFRYQWPSSFAGDILPEEESEKRASSTNLMRCFFSGMVYGDWKI